MFSFKKIPNSSFKNSSLKNITMPFIKWIVNDGNIRIRNINLELLKYWRRLG
jgi:hypothetical protein